MVYKKNYNNKKKGGYNKRFKTYSKCGSQLYKDVKMLKNLINVEFKVKDESFNVATDASGAFQLINGLTQGDDNSNRDGRQVRFKSIQMRGRVSRNASATQTRDRVKLVCFIDKQPNTAAPTWLSLYTGTDVTAFRNLDWKRRYVILWEKIVNIDEDDPSKDWKMYRKIDMKTVFDNSSSGLVSDITTNAIYIGYISEFGVNGPGMDIDTRVRFIDN